MHYRASADPLATVLPNITNGSNCPDPDRIPSVEEYREALGSFGIAFMSIGWITTVVLYALFLQQVYFTFANTHKVYRRHIYWLISIYPLTTLMSTLALMVPGAHDICSAVKVTYMSIGVAHFADLTVLMYGGEEAMVQDLHGEEMRLDVSPICCLRFLPRPAPTKWKLRMVYALVLQMPYTQSIYYFLILYLSVARVSSRSAFVWLSILNFASFLTGAYALTVINTLSFQRLQRFRYKAKSFVVKLLILTTKMQSFLFDILGNNEVFPCLSPVLTPQIYQNTVENCVFLVEMVIFGTFSYLMYRRVEFKEFDEKLLYLEPTQTVEKLSEGVGVGSSSVHGSVESSSAYGSVGSSSAYANSAYANTTPTSSEKGMFDHDVTSP